MKSLVDLGPLDPTLALALDVVQWLFLGYFALLAASYLVLNVLAFRAVRETTLAQDAEETRRGFTGLEPPISVIVPAYNEEVTIAASVGSLLQLIYGEFEVIVVNDGSRDGTRAALIQAFDMVPAAYARSAALATKPLHGVYQSRKHPNLRLVDKDNGGKADAMNAGINFARYPLVCAVDADSVLERDSLQRVARPFLADPRVVACGGTVRLLNGCTVRGGFLETVGLPRNLLALIQIVEYLRAFLFGRMGWSPLNALLIISGAFGLFRRDVVVEAGGYKSGSMGEDMELVLRLHRMLRSQKRDFRIQFVPDPICWTDAPEDLKTLASQRRRWQQGLFECLVDNRRMLLNPRYGTVGMLSLPWFWLFEAAAPVIEVAGYLFFAIGWAFGAIDPVAALVFVALALSTGLLISASSLLLEEISFHVYTRRGDFVRLVAAIVLENFGYRQLTLLWRLQGMWRYLRGTKPQWGEMTRKASWQRKTS